MKRFFTTLSLIFLTVYLIAQTPNNNVIASGYCSVNLYSEDSQWTLTEDGHLKITGKGAIRQDWIDYSHLVIHVTIEEGITELVIGPEPCIPYGTFQACRSLKTVTLPDSLTVIGKRAFESCKSLTNITIPNSVNVIEVGAFDYCENLTSITIPSSVTFTEKRIFIGCFNLAAINVDSNNQVYKGIDGNLFTKDGKTLVRYAIGKSETTYKISDSVTSIGENAFNECNLSEIIIPDSVTSIGDKAFSNCNFLEIIIPDSVASIGDKAFSNCKFSKVEIPSSVKNIGKFAFINCDKLVAITVDKKNPNYKDIDGNLFTKDGKTFIQYALGKRDTIYTIPDSVTSIEEESFLGSNTLENINIPNSVTSIGTAAFSCCDGLAHIVIPESIKSIGSNVFAMSDGLIAVVMKAIEPPSLQGSFSGPFDMEILIPLNSEKNYRSHKDWWDCNILRECACFDEEVVISGNCGVNGNDNATFELTKYGILTIKGHGAIEQSWEEYRDRISIAYIENGITELKSKSEIGVFYKCSKLTKVILPDSITVIEDKAFYECSILSKFTIPNSVVSIGNSVFYKCEHLSEIVVPNSVVSIGDLAFSNCSMLSKFILPNTKMNLGKSILWRCYRLKTIDIPESFSFTGSSSFSQCYLTSINVSNKNPEYKSIDGNLFTKDGTTLIQYAIGKSETTYKIPDSVKTIGAGAFAKCNLENVIIPNSVTSIGDSAFYAIKAESLIIPNSITSIGEEAFLFANLKSVDIPDSVISIGDSAFSDCSELTSVTIPKSVSFIGKQVFVSCENLEAIKVDSENSKYKDIDGNLFSKDGECLIQYAEGKDEKTYSIPDSVKIIGNSAFDSCSRLQTIDIPPSVIYIEDFAFYNCCSLTEVILPNSVKTIGSKVFNYCLSCTNIYIPASVTSIGDQVFWCLSKLKTLTIDKNNSSYKSINGNVFSKDGKTLIYSFGEKTDSSLIIPNTVNTIEVFAFADYKQFTNVVIPDSVITIKDYAFHLCNNIRELTIPSSVTFIGDYVFASCSQVSAITVEALEPPVLGINTFHKTLKTIYVPEDSLEKYIAHRDWRKYAQKIKAIDDNIASGICGVDGKDNATWGLKENGMLVIKGTGAIEQGWEKYRDKIVSVKINQGITELRSKIDTGTFSLCDNLTSITLPNSITTIGTESFKYCNKLESVTIPDSVTTIGEGAFCSCDSLASIKISNSVKTIEEKTFFCCRNLTNIVIPDSISTIGEWAFYNCDKLANVTISDSVITIGERAFYSCDNLSSVTISDSVKNIEDEAFSWCRKLITMNVDSNNTKFKDIDGNLFSKDGKTLIQYSSGKPKEKYTIPDSVTTIGKMAFFNCKNLTNVIIPNSVTTIGKWAFYNCDKLESITLPDLVSVIESNVFYNCDKLTAVIISDSITTIKEQAFSSCDSLVSVMIPESVTNIEDEVFSYCSKLTTINVDINNPKYKDIDGNLFSKDGKTLIKYADGKPETTYTIPKTVTTIGEKAFFACTNLISITIPDSVKIIGNNAFSGCNNLTYLSIPTSVASIGEEAFIGDYKLESFNVDNNNLTYKNIDGNLFSKDLKTFILYAIGKPEKTYTIPESVTTINERAFEGCDNLTNVKILDSVTTIKEFAFSSCKGLTTVVIPDSVTSIEAHAFDSCESLFSVTISNSIKNIGNAVFSHCKSLNNVILPNSITTIGKDAFSYCKNLTKITIPKSVTIIDEGAFFNCDSLTNLTIPKSVTTIGKNAFYDCNNMTSITIQSLEPPSLDGNTVFNDSCKLIFVPFQSIKKYMDHEDWKVYANRIRMIE